MVSNLLKFGYFFFAFCMISTTLFGQKNIHIEYYRNIHRAELKIVDSLYGEALTIYERAFKGVAFPFANDYYNAAVCSILTKNFDRSFLYLDKLVAKGLTMSVFDSAVFDPLKNQKKWRHFIKSYPSKRKKHLKSINRELRQEFELMKEQDQYFRKKEGTYEVYRDTISKIDSANAAKFLKIVEKYGFPDEQMIGIDNIYSIMPYDIVLIHNAQNASRYLQMTIRNQLSAILLQAVQEGKLSPENYASLEDYATENQSYGSMAYIRVNGKLESTLRSDDFANNNRMKIGLGTRDELRRKVLFEERDKRFCFNNQAGILTILGKVNLSK